MPRGGHIRSGPPVKPAAVRQREGSRVRDRHRSKGQAGTPAALTPPADLAPEEAVHWTYYAPLLDAAGRLTQEARGVLTSYCTARATIDRLRAQQRAPEYRDVLISVTIDGAGNEHVKATHNPLLTRLEAWTKIAHTLENDLALNPATAIRMPSTSDPADEDETPAAPVHDFFKGLRRVAG